MKSCVLVVTWALVADVVSADHCYSFGSRERCLAMPVGGAAECKWCNGGCVMERDACNGNQLHRCQTYDSCSTCTQEVTGTYAQQCRWCPSSSSCHPLSPYFPDATPCDYSIPGDVGPRRRRAVGNETALDRSLDRSRRMHWVATDYFQNSVREPDYCPDIDRGAPFFVSASAEIITNPAQRNYGVAVADIDGDGLFDAVVAGYNGANAVLSSDGQGRVIDIAGERFPTVQRRTLGVTACDLDGDGIEEVYFLNLDQYMGDGGETSKDQIFKRDPTTGGRYVDVLGRPENIGAINPGSGRSVACIDRRNTGNYSVFVSNYASSGSPRAMLVEADRDPANGGRLVDVAPALGMDTANGGRAVVVGQIFGTGSLDLFVNNEGGNGGNTGVNYLYRSNGDGTFDEVAAAAGVQDQRRTGRGTTLMDANADGLLDIVYGNWDAPDSHRMWIQNADRTTFTNRAPDAFTARSRIRTVIAADFDNDGHEEIFLNNIPGSNKLFQKIEGEEWTLRNIGDALEPMGYGTGAAVLDFDGDGVLELVVSHGESRDQPLTLYRARAGQSNHYLRILPLTAAGAPARGALVVLTNADGTVQTRSIDAGSGYLCTMEPVAHFGLGAAASYQSVLITWPGGATTTITPGTHPIDRIHAVPHPSTSQTAATPAASTAAPTSSTAAPTASTAAPTAAPTTEADAGETFAPTAAPTGSPSPAPTATTTAEVPTSSRPSPDTARSGSNGNDDGAGSTSTLVVVAVVVAVAVVVVGIVVMAVKRSGKPVAAPDQHDHGRYAGETAYANGSYRPDVLVLDDSSGGGGYLDVQ